MSDTVLLNIGYGNFVVASRVVAIASPASAPMKRLREEAFSRGKLIDVTQGRRTRSIIVTIESPGSGYFQAARFGWPARVSTRYISPTPR